MKKLLVFLFITLLYSCKQETLSPTVTFNVHNSTSASVKELTISLVSSNTSSQVSKEANIPSSSNRTITYDLKESKSIKEGGYQISAELENGKKYQENFGYFTNNGDSDPEHSYKIIITDTEVKIE